MVNALIGSFTLLYIYPLKLYLYPNGYGPNVIVGFIYLALFITLYIIHTWVDVPYIRLETQTQETIHVSIHRIIRIL